MDKNKDGQIDAKEAEEGFRKISLDQKAKGKGVQEFQLTRELFAAIDQNSNNVIDYTEFLAATLKEKNFRSRPKLEDIFDQYDRNDDGVIDV